MLDNAGGKIAFWAKVLLLAGVAFSVVAGVIMIVNGVQRGNLQYAYYQAGYLYRSGFGGGTRAVIAGILVIIGGSLASWLWALLLKAFGDLVSDTRAIRRHLADHPMPVSAETAADAAAEASVDTASAAPDAPDVPAE